MKKCAWVILLFISFLSLKAQNEPQMSSEEIKLEQRAFALFKQGNYSEALPLFSQLLSLYPQEEDYNYGYGVCMVELNRDIPKALKYLQFASGNSDNPLITYYIARCYHLLFRFDEAISRYNDFKRVALKQEIIKYDVDHKIEMCNNGRELVRYISDLIVVDNKKIIADNYYYSYDLKDFGGKLILKPVELKSKWDKKLEPQNSLAFLSKKTGQLFFASYDKLKNRDIYRVKLNDDGTFGIPENLGPYINTPWEEDYPVLHADSVTLYFSSRGHNSMGGYDIFRSVLDTATNQFSRPENLDFPVNTPYDDYLYVSDADDYYAYFASNRETSENKISVYKIIVDKSPIPRQFDNLEEIQQKALLEISTADAIRKAEEKRSATEVKPDQKPLSLNQGSSKPAFNPIVYNPGITQTQLVEEAAKDIELLKEQSEKYSKQASQAYAIADNKNREAEEKRMASANITNELYKYTDTEQKEKKKEEAYKLIEDAERLEKEAVTAFTLAKNLEKNNVELAKDIKRSENFKNAVSTAGTNVTGESLAESLNQNREKLNQSQNKYITPADEAKSRISEAEVKKKELEYYKGEENTINKQIENTENEIENLEKELATAPSERRDELNSQLFDKQEQLADLKQKRNAIAEPLEKSENEYNTLIEEAKIYNNLTADLSEDKLTADASTINKNELEKKIFDTELQIDANQTVKNNTTSDNNNQTADNNTRSNVTNQNTVSDNNDNKNNNDNNNNTTIRNETTDNNTLTAADTISTSNPNNTITANNQSNNNTIPSDNTIRESDYSNTRTLPENRKKEYSPEHSNYQQEIINARYFDNMVAEQKKQLAVLNQMNPDNPEAAKNLSKQKEDLEKKIAANEQKAAASREKASTLSASLTPQERSDTLSSVKFLTDAFDYGSGVEVKYTPEQEARLDEIDEQKAVTLTSQNIIVQKVKMYADLSVKKESVRSQELKEDIEDEMLDIADEIRDQNTSYKSNLKTSLTNEYDFYKTQTASKEFHDERVTKDAATVQKEADILHDKAISVLENAEVIEDPVARFKEYQQASELNKLAVSKQKYAFELYVKAVDEASRLAAANTTQSNPNPQSVKTTLGADEAEQLKIYRKESGKAENIISQADKKLNDIAERREKAANTYSQEEKKAILKGIDKEEQKARNEKLAGLQKLSYADSMKYLAYQSQTATMLNQQNTDKTNSAIATQYLKESEFFYNEAQKLKAEAQKDKDPASRLARYEKINEMEKKALTSQELAVEVLSEPDPVLFVSSNNLTRVERLEAIDEPISTEEVVKIRTDRIVNKINLSETELKNLDAASQKSSVVQKLKADAASYKKQIDSLKQVVSNPDANSKDRTAAQKKIAPLEKKYLASVFSAAEVSEQINDTRYYMYKEHIKPTRLNDNTTEDRQSKQLERNAATQYSKAKSLRDKSFVTENPEKAYGYLVEANELENKAIEDMERAFGLNLKLTPLEEEIKEYAEQRKQRVAPEYEAYLIRTKANVTPIETTNDTTLAGYQDTRIVADNTNTQNNQTDNSNNDTNNNSGNQDTRIVADNTNTQNNQTNNSNNDTNNNSGNQDTRIIADNSNTQNNQTDNSNNDTNNNSGNQDTRVVADNSNTQNNQTNNSNNDTNNNSGNQDTRIVADNTNTQNNQTANNNDTNNNSGNQDTRVVTDNRNTQNNQTTMNQRTGSGTPDSKIFSILPFSAYSKANPIPLNPPLPDGLVFKIQIGAFRNPIADDAFGGLNPINAETMAGGDLIRYLVGLFRTSEAAFIARDQVRKMGFRDAFVVAYMNGQRITITEARKIASMQPAEEYRTMASEETAMLNSRVVNSSSENNTGSQVRTTETTQTSAPETWNYPSVTENKDLFYTVQIGVYKNPVSPAELKNLKPVFEEKTQGFIRYTTGVFQTSEQASTEKNRIVQMGITDAFVSAYYKGQKITLTEAKKIQQQGKQATERTTQVNYPEQPVPETTSSSYPKESIVFKVQVGAYKEQVPVDMVNRFIAVARNKPLSQSAEGNTTYYMVGSFTDYNEAVKMKDAIVNDGLKDAFVVAFSGEKKIPVPEALKILNP